MIDADGFRPNVGIVIANERGQVLFARRVGGLDAWQFPQGGIGEDETPEAALYRELYEEVGLDEDCVEIVAQTNGWLRYRLPAHVRRPHFDPKFLGQKQKWFLLRALVADERVRVDQFDKVEFDFWQWVSYWYPLHKVVSFKREVYRQALQELAPSVKLIAASQGADC